MSRGTRAAGWLAAGALALAYAWWVEPAWLSVTEQTVADPDAPLANPVRILLVTDLHLGKYTRPRVLHAKIARLRRLHAREPFDLIMLGGDFIDLEPGHLPLLGDALGGFAAFGVPRFAVLGNHDHTSFPAGVAPLEACLRAHGVTVLRDQAARVTVGAQPLVIVGPDDLQEAPCYFREGVCTPPSRYRDAAGVLDVYARSDTDAPGLPRLLLSHNPDAVWLPGRRPLAVLAGHTHGGQVFLLDWLSRPMYRLLYRHLPPGSFVTWAGRQVVNGRTLIVSRGLEGAALPLRFLRPPEAVAVTLR